MLSREIAEKETGVLALPQVVRWVCFWLSFQELSVVSYRKKLVSLAEKTAATGDYLNPPINLILRSNGGLGRLPLHRLSPQDTQAFFRN